MNKNTGNADRAIRVVLGVAAIAAGVVFRSWWGALGLIPLVTGLVGFCPLYALIRVSTARHQGDRPATAKSR
jgi:hypothetical protein